MKPWFFVSYARADRDSYLEQFVADLEDEVRRKLGAAVTARTGFLDTSSIETGSQWKHELAEALRTSLVGVCLCSSAYLNSDYCGREFEVLSRRLASAESCRALLPIVWDPPRGPLPESLSRLQYTDDDFPAVYAREGLRYTMKLSRHKDDYIEFVDRLAAKIVRAGATLPLAEFQSLPPLGTIENAFRTQGGYDSDGSVASEGGPNTARFVFVAGSRAEMTNWRKAVESYSDRGAWYWKPFRPNHDAPIGKLAQGAATDLDLRYQELAVTDRLLSQLEECARANEAVVLIIDPWSLHIDGYCALMRAFDRITLINCAVLILWNASDEETTASKAQLHDRLRHAFPQKMILRLPAHDWDGTQSPAELRQNLESALNKVRMMILQVADPERTVFNADLLRRAQEQGIAAANKPVLRGPSGAR